MNPSKPKSPNAVCLDGVELVAIFAVWDSCVVLPSTKKIGSAVKSDRQMVIIYELKMTQTQQFFSMQLKTVQQKLNRLCSQHDEYMALLDITDYLASLKHLNQNNRNILSRIGQLQQDIQEIQENQTAHKQQQKEMGAFKLQKFKKSIAAIESKLQEYSGSLFQMQLYLKKVEKDTENFAYHQQLNKVNTSIQGIIQKDTNSLHLSVAQFKNDLEINIIQMSTITKGICQDRYLENVNVNNSSQQSVLLLNDTQSIKQSKQISIQDLTKQVFKTSLEQYDQLIHEIMQYRIQFPIPPLLPFVQHTCEDFRQKISWLYFKVNVHEQLNNSQFSLLKQEYQTLSYRIKALKNHVLCQLLQLYQQSEQKLEVNRLQKQIESMIKQTDNRFELFRAFLQKAQDLRQYRMPQQ